MIFRTRPDRPWGPPSLLYNGYWVFSPGTQQQGRGVDHPTPFGAEVEETAVIPLLPLWNLMACSRWTLPSHVTTPYIWSLAWGKKTDREHWRKNRWECLDLGGGQYVIKDNVQFVLTKYYCDNQMKEDQMGKTRSMQRRLRKECRTLMEKPRGNGLLTGNYQHFECRFCFLTY